MSKLRGFQLAVKNDIYEAWQRGSQVVMAVLPTGAGKTVLMGDIARDHNDCGISIAHRGELVMQLSVALAREGVRHDIVAPQAVIRAIVAAHVSEVGASYYNHRAKWKVASVDTLLRRNLDDSWCRRVGMVHQDEGHHVLAENKWGRAMGLFPNARALLPTATPLRADGRGLGRHAHGLVDALVEGPNMRWLIDNGYLSDYRILAPTPDDFSMAGVDISGTTGDYNYDQMRRKVKATTTIVGNVVETYKAHASGKLGVTFAVDIEHATQITAAFNAAGVPAALVTAETSDSERVSLMRRFKQREILQLVNVDLFGEGVDVPAIEVVSMARPTASYGLFTQQFGRALRLVIPPALVGQWENMTAEQRKAALASGEKPHATVIDHVANIITHFGPPDWRKEPWSLDARTKRKSEAGKIPLRNCANKTCLQPFERIYPTCPHCGWVPPLPAERGSIEHVDGDVVLYTPELLQQLFGAKKRVDGPALIPFNASPMVANSVRKAHRERQEQQQKLRDAMKLELPPNNDDRVNNRRFFFNYGIDTLGAQSLGATEAAELRERILTKMGATK